MMLKRTFAMVVALASLLVLGGASAYAVSSPPSPTQVFAQIAPLVMPPPKPAPDRLPDSKPATTPPAFMTPATRIAPHSDTNRPYAITPSAKRGERSGLPFSAQNIEIIGEAAAVALMLVIIVCYAVHVHVQQKREDEAKKQKHQRR
jgi:hypothetical protein